MTLPVAQQITHKRRPLRPDLGRRREGVSPDGAETADRRTCPPTCGSRPRRKTPTAARKKSARTSASSDRPPRLRVRRRLRRRLPDLQHLLDHGRPAGLRVRDAADAGRIAAPDPDLGPARSARDRRPRRTDRDRLRLPDRGAAQCPVRSVRDRFADDRPGDGDPHDHRLPAGRDRRHRGLLDGSRPALDPGAADRGAPRRRDDPEPRPQAGPPRDLASCSASAAWRCFWSACSATPVVAAPLCCSAPAPSGSSSESRSSPRGWCRRWLPWPAGRWSAPGADRPARTRELPAQPEPHRGYRGGADDRPRRGRLRDRLRSGPEELGRLGRRRKLRRRPGDPEHRRLLADPPARRGWRKGPRRRSGGDDPLRQAKLVGERHDAGQPRRPTTSARRSKSNGSREARPCCAASPAAGGRLEIVRHPTTTSKSGIASVC